MSDEINSTGEKYAELLRSYSEKIVSSKEAAEADGGIEKVTYYDTQMIVYSRNGSAWTINWGD